MYRGQVTAVDAKGVYVLVPSLHPTAPFGPLDHVGARPAVGARVLVADCGDESAPDLVVMTGSGPATSTDNAVARFDGTGGAVQNSGVTIDDGGKVTLGDVGSTAGLEFGASGPRQMMGTGGPSGISAPVGSTWRQTDANTSHGSLTGLLWNKVGTGTTEGTDWLVDFEGQWITYTVNVTGWTKGSGTVTGYYTRTGRQVSWHCTFALNSTTVSGSLTLSLPVTPAAYTAGEGVLVDFGTSTYLALVRLLDTGLAYVSAIGTNGAFLSPTSTVPFTWANGDSVIVSATYRISGDDEPPVPAEPGTVYGSGHSMDALGNAQIGGDSSGCANNDVDFYFVARETSTLTGFKAYWLGYLESGYGGGDGGTYQIQVQTDDGNGLPSGTVLASTDFVCNYPYSYFGLITFASPPSLTKGTKYHLVFKNTGSDPVTNFASVNLCWSEYPTSPRCPKYADDEFGMLRKWYSPNGGWGSDTSDAVYIPILDLAYGNGKHHGQGYMEVDYDTPPGPGAHIGGSNQTRLRFTPTEPHQVSEVYVRLGKYTGSSGDVTIELKQGSTTLRTVTVDSSAITTAVYEDANHTAGDFEGGSFASLSLLAGVEYTLLLTGGAYTAAWSRPIQNGGSDYGLHPGTYFDEGSVLEVSSDSGSSWVEPDGVAGCGCLQFYLI